MSDTLQGQAGKAKQEKKVIQSFMGVVTTNSGNPITPVFKRIYDKDLDRNIVKKVDEYNLDEFIQASRSTTDLAVLQKRFMELGEIPNVNGAGWQVDDLTKYPSNIHEVYAMVNDVDKSFNSLPQSVQQIFGTKEAYLKAIMDGTYQATLVAAIQQPKKEAPVKEEEAPKGE